MNELTLKLARGLASVMKPRPDIHYGPIYGRAVGETMALCKPVGSTATMSNAWHMVDCPECLKQRFNREIL